MSNQAIILRDLNTPVKLENVNEPKLLANQVIIRHTAIAVTYNDMYDIIGLSKGKNLPLIPGHSAVGIVEEAAPGVKLKKGTRVSYSFAQYGAYSLRRSINVDYLYPIPDNISDDIAAASLYPGMIAHMCAYRVFNIKSKDTILIQNVTDAAGLLLCQWPKRKKAKVIGTVPSQDKKDYARRYGCDLVVSYDEDIVKMVREFTKGQGVKIVYDSVGKKTFPISFKSVGPLGLIVTYDQSCGAAAAINLQSLGAKSIFITKPNVFLYKQNLIEASLTAVEIFGLISKNKLNIEIGNKYKLNDANLAFNDLRKQKYAGSLILNP